jgi:hypothetical protein
MLEQNLFVEGGLVACEQSIEHLFKTLNRLWSRVSLYVSLQQRAQAKGPME